MLILTRKIGETVVINDEIRFTILGIKGNQIRIGCTADESVSIHREEIWDKIQAAKINPNLSKPILKLKSVGNQ